MVSRVLERRWIERKRRAPSVRSPRRKRPHAAQKATRGPSLFEHAIARDQWARGCQLGRSESVGTARPTAISPLTSSPVVGGLSRSGAKERLSFLGRDERPDYSIRQWRRGSCPATPSRGAKLHPCHARRRIWLCVQPSWPTERPPLSARARTTLSAFLTRSSRAALAPRSRD